MKNPLLTPFVEPYQATPFSSIKSEHFIPAIKENIVTALAEVDTIVRQPTTPTFKNTIEALQDCGLLMERNTSLLFNLNSAETSDELQQIAQQAAPLLTKFQNDIRLNTKLFERIRFVYENEDRNNLNAEQQTLLEKEFKGFARNGVLLDDQDKERLCAIDTELAQLSLTFGENVLADTNAFSLLIENEEDLKGLHETAIELAAQQAREKGKSGWLFTLDYPSYVPFMTYSENRALRKKMSLAFGKRGFQKNKHNNTSIILRMIRLRKQRAELLGYSSHAVFVLEERMATSEKTVKEFLENLYQKALPPAQKEWEQMEAFARKELGIDDIEKWDSAFVSEKLKKALLDFDEQQLRSYFPLEKVVTGLFKIVEKLYGLRFVVNKDLEGYHKDVDVYEVFNDKDEFYALLYVDFFSRPGKRSGAWMTYYRPQKIGQRPHISIVCNFSKPTKTKPSLLTFQEVRTLFHEFGHALHGMLANTVYSQLSGVNVYWDFVELPSQIMENWCYEPEALRYFARHFQTDEVIPNEFVERIKKSAHFQQGLQTLRQLGFGFLDLSYHSADISSITDVKSHELEQLKRVQFTKEPAENSASTAFSHIFQGGYAAGYYSYKWTEVLDADAFELFLEKGIFDSKTAKSFATNILSKGGTEPPMTLYLRFRGKKPDPEALLRRAGLI